MDLFEFLVVAGHAILLSKCSKFGNALPCLLHPSLQEVAPVVGGINSAEKSVQFWADLLYLLQKIAAVHL